MKKLLLTALTLLFAAPVSLAQKIDTIKKSHYHKYQFGIKLGMGQTMMSSNISPEKGDRPAAVIGFWGKYQFRNTDKLSLQTEFFFGYYGEYFYGSTPQSGATAVYFNTYNLPVLLNYKIGNRNFSGHIATGPALQVITKHDNAPYLTGSYFGWGFSSMLKYDNNIAVYWAAGAGIDYKRLTLDVRYTQGINNINTAGYSQRLNNVVASLAVRIF